MINLGIGLIAGLVAGVLVILLVQKLTKKKYKFKKDGEYWWENVERKINDKKEGEKDGWI